MDVFGVGEGRRPKRKTCRRKKSAKGGSFLDQLKLINQMNNSSKGSTAHTEASKKLYSMARTGGIGTAGMVALGDGRRRRKSTRKALKSRKGGIGTAGMVALGDGDGGMYRTKKADTKDKALNAFVKSLMKKKYTKKGAKSLFGKEEKKSKVIKSTRGYAHGRKQKEPAQFGAWREFLEDYKNRVGWTPGNPKYPYKKLLSEASRAFK